MRKMGLSTCSEHTEEAVSFAVKERHTRMYVTEDTTRANPETVRALYKTAIECGARRRVRLRYCWASTPNGARALVKFVKV